MIAEWRAVVGYEGYYEISSYGEVRSIAETHGNKVLIQTRTSKGYRTIRLYRSGKKKGARVHRLVLEAFVGPCPTGMLCRHNDGVPWNNYYKNLSWTTPKINQADRVAHGTSNRGERQGRSRLCAEDVHRLRDMRRSGGRFADMATIFNVHLQTCVAAVKGRSWAHLVNHRQYCP